MKNLFLIAAVLFAFSASSCKKDYTCACTSGDIEIKDAKKKDAEDTCDALDAAEKIFDPTASCKLK